MMNTYRLALVAAAALCLPAGAASAPSSQNERAPSRSQAERTREAEAEARAKARAKARSREAAPDDSQRPSERSDRLVRTFKAHDGAVLVLSNITGNITVKAGGPEVTLEAVKRVRAATDADAARQLGTTVIDIEERGGRIEVRTRYTGEKSHRVAVDYRVTAPREVGLDLRSVAGDIVIDGIRGEVRAETVSGGVTVAGLARETTLKAVSGDVTVSASALDGGLSASSVSGSVHVRSVKARLVSAGTVSGNVTLIGGACERALVRSVNGQIEIATALLAGGRYEAKSHAGSIRLVVDGKTGFEVEANSFSGDIKTELPLTVQSRSDGRRHGPPSQSLRAVYADGSARVELASFSGDITIVAKGK
jgi:DUF4097 and DUF4098 domain-containing protein YvlB